MRKRPLFTGAFLFALIIWLLVSVFGVDFFPKKIADGKQVSLSGVVYKTEEKSSRIYVYLQQVTCEGTHDGRQQGTGALSTQYTRVLLVSDKTDEAASLKAGNRIQAKASCDGFQKARNQGNFDEEYYYHSLGVQEKFRLQGEILVIDHKVFPLHCAMQWVRMRVLDTVKSLTGSQDYHADIFAAILTGDRSGIDPDTKDLYLKSGISHILSISGLHISFLGMTLFSLLRKRIPFLPAAVISGAVMICFCIMSGESVSAVRATLMFLLRLLAAKCGKTFDLLSALGCAAIFLMAENPMCLYQTGFQLSFGAILGIGLLLPAFRISGETPAKNRTPSMYSFLRKGVEKCGAAFLASLSVTLLTMPILLHTYYELPVFSILLNLLVVPMMGFVLESGAVGTLFGLFSLFFGRMLMGLGVYLVSLIEWLCAVMDHIPFSILITGEVHGLQVVIFYLCLIFVMLLLRGKQLRFQKVRRILCMAFLFAAVFVLVLPKSRAGDLVITFFDVDQGDGILVESPSGTVYMIDGGSSSVTDLYRYRLESALKYKGIAQIDYAIVTHTDTDHISGLLEMLRKTGAGRIRVGAILVPPIADNEHYEELTQAAEEAGIEVVDLYRGMTIKDPAMSFRCIYPEKGYASDDVNSYSAVLYLTYRTFDALFTGDIGEEEEKVLLKSGALKDCELLKVAHHGSRFSSCPEFLETVSPEIAVVSAGVDNRYGHPHPDTLSRLTQCSAEVYVTAESGETIVLVSEDGHSQVQELLTAESHHLTLA